jgi:hypothetical protein
MLRLATLALATLSLAATTASAQIVVVGSPPPPPVVTYYEPAPIYVQPAPVVSFSAPVLAPAVRYSYYTPATTVYSAPVFAPATVVAPAGVVTTRTYYGFGILRPRGWHTETYVSPVFPR